MIALLFPVCLFDLVTSHQRSDITLRLLVLATTKLNDFKD